MQGAAAGGTSVSGASWARATRGRAAVLASRHVGVGASSSDYYYNHFGPRGATAAPLLRARGGGRLRPLPLLSGSGKNGEVAKAAAAAASVPADDASAAAVTTDGGGIAATAQLGAMIVAWYLLNIYFNIYNKQVWPAAVHRSISRDPQIPSTLLPPDDQHQPSSPVAGSRRAAVAAAVHHHRLPARVRLPAHLPHVGHQAPPGAQALRCAGEAILLRGEAAIFPLSLFFPPAWFAAS
jgi:hypothetical protein